MRNLHLGHFIEATSFSYLLRLTEEDYYGLIIEAVSFSLSFDAASLIYAASLRIEADSLRFASSFALIQLAHRAIILICYI